MNRYKEIAAATFALLLLAGCGSSGNGGGTGDKKSVSESPVIVHGTVRSLDSVQERVPYRRSISIDRGYGSYLTIEYTASTPVSFNGRSYAPEDLEPGNEIDVALSA
jgi:hypothetical protein